MEMSRVLTGGVAVSSCLVGAYFFFAPDTYRPVAMKSEFERFCLRCEDVLKDRLKSPSSYTRTECSGPYTEAATREEYLRHDRLEDWDKISDFTRHNIENGELRITTAYLKYEAANGFGASIAGIQACTIDHREGRSYLDATDIVGPYVGGYSDTGWVIHQLTGNR
jgi:hypothetical protein